MYVFGDREWRWWMPCCHLQRCTCGTLSLAIGLLVQLRACSQVLITSQQARCTQRLTCAPSTHCHVHGQPLTLQVFLQLHSTSLALHMTYACAPRHVHRQSTAAASYVRQFVALRFKDCKLECSSMVNGRVRVHVKAYCVELTKAAIGSRFAGHMILSVEWVAHALSTQRRTSEPTGVSEFC